MSSNKYINNKIVAFCMTLFLSLCSLNSVAADKLLRIVILGSSTAEGTGASAGQGWVARYTNYIKSINPRYEVMNLAKGGYNTFNIMPNGNTGSSSYTPDSERNITKALLYSPHVIIVNMPSNDINAGFSVSEVLANYAALKSIADAAGVQIYFATTQPRNMSTQKMQDQMAVRDATISTYPDRYLDFWTDLATLDGEIVTLYNHDGIHVNDAGHEILLNRVIATSSILTHAKEVGVDNYSDLGRVLIDFGGTNGVLSSGNWNNVTGPRQVGTTYAVPLKNTSNEKTPFRIYVHDSFNEINYEGVAVGVKVLDYPNSASNDSFFGNAGQTFNSVNEPTAGVTLDYLDVDKVYSLKFLSARSGANDNRETKFTIIGKTTQTLTVNSSKNIATYPVQDIEPDANGKIIIEITAGSANNHSNGFYYLNVLDIEYKPKVLPVELRSFKVIGQGNYIDIQWATLIETTNSHFEIFRAGADNNFAKLTTIPASSNNGVNSYSFRDRAPLFGNNYYFLRQVDYNGDFKDFEIKSVNFSNKIQTLNTYVPVGSNKILLSAPENNAEQIISVAVRYVDGRQVFNKDINLQKGQNLIEIGALSARGVYIVTVKQQDKLQSFKVSY